MTKDVVSYQKNSWIFAKHGIYANLLQQVIISKTSELVERFNGTVVLILKRYVYETPNT